ncbi:hypothetical protein FRC03_002907 [Tulasnella sp. 419]|nr:hypothetical protein FRC03_002907 [Tulasnella sp. 419]
MVAKSGLDQSDAEEDSIFWYLQDDIRAELSANETDQVDQSAPQCEACRPMEAHPPGDDRLVRVFGELHVKDCLYAPSYCVNHPLCQEHILRKDAIAHGLACIHNRCKNADLGCAFKGTCLEQTIHERCCLQKEQYHIAALKDEVRRLEEELQALSNGEPVNYSTLGRMIHSSASTTTTSTLPAVISPPNGRRVSLDFNIGPAPSPPKRSSSADITTFVKRPRIQEASFRSTSEGVRFLPLNTITGQKSCVDNLVENAGTCGTDASTPGTADGHSKLNMQPLLNPKKKIQAPRLTRILPQGADPANPPPLPHFDDLSNDSFVREHPRTADPPSPPRANPSSDDIPLSQVKLPYRWKEYHSAH